jgi:hypothetical protein
LVIASANAKVATAINPRAKPPLEKIKKIFSQTLALTQLIAYFCVVRIRQ